MTIVRCLSFRKKIFIKNLIQRRCPRFLIPILDKFGGKTSLNTHRGITKNCSADIIVISEIDTWTNGSCVRRHHNEKWCTKNSLSHQSHFTPLQRMSIRCEEDIFCNHSVDTLNYLSDLDSYSYRRIQFSDNFENLTNFQSSRKVIFLRKKIKTAVLRSQRQHFVQFVGPTNLSRGKEKLWGEVPKICENYYSKTSQITNICLILLSFLDIMRKWILKTQIIGGQRLLEFKNSLASLLIWCCNAVYTFLVLLLLGTANMRLPSIARQLFPPSNSLPIHTPNNSRNWHVLIEKQAIEVFSICLPLHIWPIRAKSTKWTVHDNNLILIRRIYVIFIFKIVLLTMFCAFCVFSIFLNFSTLWFLQNKVNKVNPVSLTRNRLTSSYIVACDCDRGWSLSWSV